MNLKPALKLTCTLWLMALLVGALQLPAQAAEKALPDLVITDFWVESGIVHYQIMNQGEAPTPATSHITRLVVDGTLMDSDTISTVLAAGQRLERITHYPETCSGSEDVLVFEADATHLIGESDEGNNSRQETWRCDSTPPVFSSGPSVSSITQTSAMVSWGTNEATTGLVEYGILSGQYPWSRLDASSTTSHSLGLSELFPNMVYQLRVVASDAAGNQTTSKTLFFSTLANSDTQNPAFSAWSMGAPSPDLSYFRVETTVSDNQGVERVELWMDGGLIASDYSVSESGVFSFDLIPGNLGLTREEFYSQHSFSSVAFDPSGNLVEIEQMVEPPLPPMDGAVEFNWPDDGLEYPVPWATVPSGTLRTLSVSAWEYGLEFCPSPELFGCQRLRRPVERVEFYIENTYKATAYPDPDDPYLFTYTWDMSGLYLGDYEIEAVAYATDGSKLNHIHILSIEYAQAQVNLIRTVHHHGSGFLVQLELKNEGTLAADIIKVTDRVSGFQPVVQEWNQTYIYKLSYDPASQKSEVVFDFERVTQPSYRLYPGSSLLLQYWLVPLRYPGVAGVPGFEPHWGYQIGSDPSLVERVDGSLTWPYSFNLPTTRTAEGQDLLAAVNEIQQSANFLIVTHPEHLLAAASDDDRAVEVMAYAADLALAKGGSMAYVTGEGNVDEVDAIIERWGADMTSASGQPGGWLGDGYLLLVGENEIIPAGNYTVTSWFFFDKTVHLADAAYANTAGGSIDPELMVGRLILSADELWMPLRNLAALERNLTGYGFDRSNALVVSGFPTTRDGDSDYIDFTVERSVISYSLAANGSSVVQLNTPDYVTGDAAVAAIFAAAPEQDILHLAGHGSPWSLDDLSAGQVFQQSGPFGSTNPFVFGSSCLTGRYSGEYKDYTIHSGLAEAFLWEGAAAYFGSTEISYFPPSRWMTELFYDRWTPGRSIGSAIKETKIVAGGSHALAFYEDLWSIEFQIYGDPELGADAKESSTPQASQTSFAPVLATTTPKFAIPQFTVEYDDQENAEVSIPGGSWLMAEGKPILPSYPYVVTIPKGQRVQDVTFLGRSGLQTGSGLNIPPMEVKEVGSAVLQVGEAKTGEEWWPNQLFNWEINDQPDGSSLLIIYAYPFFYNSLTTDYEFYTTYSFDVALTYDSPVEILEIQPESLAYTGEELVSLDVWVKNNSDEPLDVILEARVNNHSSEEIAGGFVLRKLTGLAGLGTVALKWDSLGTPAGDYTIQVIARDLAGNILDEQSTDIRIGISRLETDNWGVAPLVFFPGEPVQVDFRVLNTGSIAQSGSAVIQVLSPDLGIVAAYQQSIEALPAGQSVWISQTWDTSGVQDGSFKIIGYVDYASMSTPILSAELKTAPRIFLPIIKR